MTVLPLPPVNRYGPPAEPRRYFAYVWDTMDVPDKQEVIGSPVPGMEPQPIVIFTPTFDKLAVYGREVTSPYEEDLDGLQRLKERGRVMGEWFSVACPEGELGSMALDEITEITVEQFSAAFKREWK